MRRRLIVLAALAVLTGCAGSTQAYPSPDGRFTLEVTEDTHLADPVWHVVVQVGVAGTVGSWSVGCLYPDDPPTVVVWTGPLTFRVGTGARQDAVVQLEVSGETRQITQPGDALRPCP